MARATNKVCAKPGCPTITTQPRCPTHTRDIERYQRATVPTKHTRTWAEQRRRKAVVDAWRRTHGDICPGYKKPPHPSSDLTADHIQAVANGGRPDGPLTVLCRQCNSARGNRA